MGDLREIIARVRETGCAGQCCVSQKELGILLDAAERASIAEEQWDIAVEALREIAWAQVPYNRAPSDIASEAIARINEVEP